MRCPCACRQRRLSQDERRVFGTLEAVGLLARRGFFELQLCPFPVAGVGHPGHFETSFCVPGTGHRTLFIRVAGAALSACSKMVGRRGSK